MASDDRVRAAWNAAIKHLVTKGWQNAREPGDTWNEDWLKAMSAALDAADAFALTPAQKEAEGMVEVLRACVSAEDETRYSLIPARLSLLAREIIARIDGGK